MSDAIREQIVKVAKLMYEKGMVKRFCRKPFRSGRQQCLHYTQRYMQRFFKGRHDCENRYERKYTGRDVQAFV